jgi:hypothetical protein
MKSRSLAIVCSLFACMLLAANAEAKKPYLSSVNGTCGTNYDCGLCHVDPGGGGQLTSSGQEFRDNNYDPTVFCPGSTCTDFDGDGFALEGGNCGEIDCDDSNAAINPGAAEVCDDGTDNDCDTKVDCADGECSLALVCGTPPELEICDDGIDNDGDNKIDCADKRDCGKELICLIGDGGGGGDPQAEVCDDGIDNDGDGRVDCADKRDCGKDPYCN